MATSRQLTARKMSKASGVKRTAVWRMLKSEVSGEKLRPCKTPHKLTEKMKRNRLKWCRKFLKFLEKNKDNIVTCFETYLS